MGNSGSPHKFTSKTYNIDSSHKAAERIVEESERRLLIQSMPIQVTPEIHKQIGILDYMGIR